jgi:hypothetical protein
MCKAEMNFLVVFFLFCYLFLIFLEKGKNAKNIILPRIYLTPSFLFSYPIKSIFEYFMILILYKI